MIPMRSPLSGSDNCCLLKTINASEIKRRWSEELGIDWSMPSDLDHIYYWLDNRTGLRFYTPNEAAGGPDLYQRLQRFSWYYMSDKWEFKAALRFLDGLKTISYTPKVLEVGVGKGSFLAQARAARFDISGVELNPDAASAARHQGFSIYEHDLGAIDSTGKWDAICSFQVLEHLSNPRLFFEQTLSLLKESGFLIVSVPNAAIARSLDPEITDLLDQPPHHMSHWNEDVFRSVESFLPFKVKLVQFEPLASYHINGFVYGWTKRLRSRLGFVPASLVLNPFTYPLVRFSLALGLRRLVRGHTLLVCLQKISSDQTTAL